MWGRRRSNLLSTKDINVVLSIQSISNGFTALSTLIPSVHNKLERINRLTASPPSRRGSDMISNIFHHSVETLDLTNLCGGRAADSL